MQTVIAVVAEQSESINVHNWFLALEQRINAFQNVHIVMDIEYAPSIKFLKRLQDSGFANSIGAQQMIQSSNELVSDYTPPLYVCKQPKHSFGTLGKLAETVMIQMYNTSHDKLFQRHYTEADAKKPLADAVSRASPGRPVLRINGVERLRLCVEPAPSGASHNLEAAS
jgi:hypothetical protein